MEDKRLLFGALIGGAAIGGVLYHLCRGRRCPREPVWPQFVIAKTIDCHCGGLPARIVVDGAPDTSEARSCMERRDILQRKKDWFRKLMLQEPRGYPCQNVDIVYPPTQACPQADFSFVIGENAGVYPSMSGHNTICTVTALLETGLVPMKEPVTEFVLEAPVGPIAITAECKNGKATNVTFRNCACFVGHLDVVVNVPTVGNVVVDIAFGGMWYCIVDLDHPQNSLLEHIKPLKPDQGGEIVKLGEMIKVACREQYPVQHPEFDYPGCDIMAFRCEPKGRFDDQRANDVICHNAVVMSTGKLDWDNPATWKGNIDRSPCGTGTCAIMATFYARGLLYPGQTFINESVLGSKFVGRILEKTTVGGKLGMIPTITGSAVVTQVSSIILHPDDPFQQGYTVQDIWA
mmetsp:Transcript_37867/g.61589  ORF Transcript_37867/g.61589 Transcript_37867/m.61589 type:complete len:404 (+) Transcript_37867:61-1272(+)